MHTPRHRVPADRKLAALTRAGIIALPAVLALPPLRSWLESSMTLHMLVQMPLLATAGFVSVAALPASCSRALANAVGGTVPCVLFASLASMFWMVPRALDLALAEPAMELAKFAVLPLLVGAPLGLAWPRIGVLGHGFVWANLASMLMVLGWLYRAAPVRVCNAYAVSGQLQAGEWMILLALVICIGWLATLLAGSPGAPRAR